MTGFTIAVIAIIGLMALVYFGWGRFVQMLDDWEEQVERTEHAYRERLHAPLPPPYADCPCRHCQPGAGG